MGLAFIIAIAVIGPVAFAWVIRHDWAGLSRRERALSLVFYVLLIVAMVHMVVLAFRETMQS
jgi:hypothetical protein